MAADSRLQRIAGRAEEGAGGVLLVHDKCTGELLAAGQSASAEDVGRALASARDALTAWSSRSLEAREQILRRYAELVRDSQTQLAQLLSRETGKPPWESRAEIAAVAGKVELSVRAHHERCAARDFASGEARAQLRFRPHGVAAVFGPFNMPAHLPNGHFVPALLAGNTIVLKPSELTPLVALRLVDLLESAGLPAGAMNVVQGGADVGRHLAGSPLLDALFFTGSERVGLELGRASLDYPRRIVALEMGGNNPLVVHSVRDLSGAARQTILSAYISAGQRCTCARRLIVPRGEPGDRFLDELVRATESLKVGDYADRPEPFCGPVISAAAAKSALAAQERLIAAGAVPLLPLRQRAGRENLLQPALLDCSGIAELPDEEVFAPLLQVVRVADFAAAVEEAGRTRFGLAAGLFSDEPEHYETFRSSVRAGVVNWNRWTTGASGALPFGGLGHSGNHRPAGYFSADYCSYPVASLERSQLDSPDELPPGIA